MYSVCKWRKCKCYYRAQELKQEEISQIQNILSRELNAKNRKYTYIFKIKNFFRDFFSKSIED